MGINNVYHGQNKSSSFPGPSLGTSHHVLPLHDEWKGVALDRSRFIITRPEITQVIVGDLEGKELNNVALIIY